MEPGSNHSAPPKPRGNAEAALAAAAVRHRTEYQVPIEHHNPIELFASTVIFEPDGKLTVYDKTQGVQNVQHYLRSVLDMEPHEVRVISPFVGGAFGRGCALSSGGAGCSLARANAGAPRPGHNVLWLGYRPAMIHQIELGAIWRNARRHRSQAVTVTSQYEDFHRQDRLVRPFSAQPTALAAQIL